VMNLAAFGVPCASGRALSTSRGTGNNDGH
jgi:hypothetical protein